MKFFLFQKVLPRMIDDENHLCAKNEKLSSL